MEALNDPLEKHWLAIKRPSNGDRRIIPNETALIRRIVIVRSFIQHVSELGEYNKAMRETRRNP